MTAVDEVDSRRQGWGGQNKGDGCQTLRNGIWLNDKKHDIERIRESQSGKMEIKIGFVKCEWVGCSYDSHPPIVTQ